MGGVSLVQMGQPPSSPAPPLLLRRWARQPSPREETAQLSSEPPTLHNAPKGNPEKMLNLCQSCLNLQIYLWIKWQNEANSAEIAYHPSNDYPLQCFTFAPSSVLFPERQCTTLPCIYLSGGSRNGSSRSPHWLQFFRILQHLHLPFSLGIMLSPPFSLSFRRSMTTAQDCTTSAAFKC